jgi:pimeloyl-ACP methyl ester carboxylesterase
MENGRWLLVHGAGGGGWEWAIWQRVLRARGVDALAPDLVPASDGLAATTLEDYRAQVVALARDVATGAVAAAAAPAGQVRGMGNGGRREPDRPSMPAPVVVGASLGGLLAAMACEAVAARALVLVNPLPPSPFHALLPARAPSPPVIPWGAGATLASTRRALPDAMDATCEWAWRRWRDESGAVVDAARGGVRVARPDCPVLVIASGADDEVPMAASSALAEAWQADLWRLPGASHVGPLLGRGAAGCAERIVAWVDSIRPLS